MDDKAHEIYLRHMLDAISRIERYIAGVRKESFFADDSMVAAAVVRERLKCKIRWLSLSV